MKVPFSIELGQGRPRQIGKTFFQGQQAMSDLARLYDLHAEDCARAAEKTDDPRHRAMLIKLVDEWRKAAQELRQHPSPSQEQPPPSQKLQAQRPASHARRGHKG
jgi:hypothetical protein